MSRLRYCRDQICRISDASPAVWDTHEKGIHSGFRDSIHTLGEPGGIAHW
jgi:hypothetical protein